MEEILCRVFAVTEKGIVDTKKEIKLNLVQYGITQVDIGKERVVAWVIGKGLVAVPKKWLD